MRSRGNAHIFGGEKQFMIMFPAKDAPHLAGPRSPQRPLVIRRFGDPRTLLIPLAKHVGEITNTTQI